MTWKEFFNKEIEKENYQKLIAFIDEEYKKNICYPKKDDIFKAFELTEINDIKVVIFGQDPYFNSEEAMGLAFSVNPGVKIPPSLKNIYKEIDKEFDNYSILNSGDLTYLAKQGVLLLNTYLTVRKNEPLSHKNSLYMDFFKDILDVLNKEDHPIVFMLWGNEAKKYKKYLNNKNHLILECAHPSPLSANKGGWFNSNIFINANIFLIKNNLTAIDWINPENKTLF